MGAPPLPPPPGASGWLPSDPSTASNASRDPFIGRPRWRQGRPGWTLVHIAIGLGIAFVAFVVSVGIGSIGRTQAEMDNADPAPTVIGTLLVLGSSLAGWVLFAYGSLSLARRWILLGLLTAGSVAIAAILFSVASA
jgi:hypothetical protein